jgi:hypothetical protein
LTALLRLETLLAQDNALETTNDAQESLGPQADATLRLEQRLKELEQQDASSSSKLEGIEQRVERVSVQKEELQSKLNLQADALEAASVRLDEEIQAKAMSQAHASDLELMVEEYEELLEEPVEEEEEEEPEKEELPRYPVAIIEQAKMLVYRAFS